MIVEIPEAPDFARASINLLNLAWEIAVYSIRAWNHSEVINPTILPDRTYTRQDGTTVFVPGDANAPTKEEQAAADTEFWRRSQPSLGNALSLIQQSIELALKGRISQVSPFLLIVRDARDYPKGSMKEDVPFSAFRSLDAADLMRVHDSVCSDRLGETFAQFWDEIRRERNAIIHTVSQNAPLVRPERLMGLVLIVNAVLYPGKTWFDRRLNYALTDETQVAFHPDPKETYARILDEFGDAIWFLPKPFLKQHLGLDPRARRYSCVACRALCDEECWSDWELGETAQLHPKGPATTKLVCVLCRRETVAIRERCPDEKCGCMVLSGEPGPFFRHCLTCGQEPFEEEKDT